MAKGMLPGRDPGHDVIVIGGSAGAFEPLRTILRGLPANLPAAVLVTLHLGAESHLAQLLDRASALPVSSAEPGRTLTPGQVHVAVPDLHLMLHDGHMILRRGPRENLARPAIDPLFRSAACSFGGRVIGVLLSGSLNDGAAGLRAIKQCGGLAVVQDPGEAAYTDMPLGALRHAAVDHVTPAAAIGELLARLARTPAGPTPAIPLELRLETAIAAQELAGMEAEDRLGTPSRFTCPECHGALWEIDDGSLLRYRCHVGHAFTAEAMFRAQAVGAEEMLWNLARAHQEHAALARRMAERERALQRNELAERLLERATGYDEDAQVVYGLLRRQRSVTEAGSREQES